MSHHEYFPVHELSATTYSAPSTELQCMATVFPVPTSEFDPRKDSEQLREAMKNTVLKGIGVDKQTIIDILTTRGCVQRLAIAQSFKTMYGKDITEAFRSTLTGDFQRLVTALMAPLDELYAQELHWAMSGPGTSEKTLIEILCTLSNGGIRYVASAYERLYKMALEDHLKRNTSFYFKRLLVSLSQGNRDESSTVDQGQVEKDAEDLYKAGVARWGTDETVFNAIMAFRSYPHLKEVFRKYADIAGHDIVDAINNEFSGDIKDAHLTIVQCVRNKSVFFAQRLHWSMKGLGTDERTLIRIVVARSEIDLGDIKQQFEEMYQGRLEDWIKDDTSGHFQKALLKLIDCA